MPGRWCLRENQDAVAFDDPSRAGSGAGVNVWFALCTLRFGEFGLYQPMRISPLRSVVFLVATTSLWADDHDVTTVTYTLDGTTLEGTWVVPEDADEALPGILMVPNWLGPTEASLEKAKEIADDEFVVFMADMYGVEVRPTNSEEAGQAAGAIRADRMLMRARAEKALTLMREQAAERMMDPTKVAAIGFCFGGGTVLELARGGADVDAVVSFHGDLLSPTLEADAAQTKAAVLVLHGARDPFVPQAHVATWVETMLTTDVDWQLIQYAAAVHSFTDPDANWPGQAEYHAPTAARAFEAMEDFFEERWENED